MKFYIRNNNALLSLLLMIAVALVSFITFKYIGGFTIFNKIMDALIPVLFAIAISFIIEPIISFFISKKVSRPISVILTYVLLLTLFTIILMLIIPSLIFQIQRFIDELPLIINDIDKTISSISQGLGIDFSFKDYMQKVMSGITNSSLNDLGNFGNMFVKFSLAVTGAVFLSFDYPSFRRKIKKLVPKKYTVPVNDFVHEFAPFVQKYTLGILLDGFILWIMASIVFYFVGLSYPVIFGLIVAVINLIPMIGAFIGGAPAVIFGFLTSWQIGIWTLIVLVIVQFIESNIIQPLILKNVISLHPLEGIFAFSLFASLFGIIGMIISPMIVVGIKIIMSQILHVDKEVLDLVNHDDTKPLDKKSET